MIYPSEVRVLQQWYTWAHQAEELGFSKRDAHELAELRRRYYAGIVTEFPAQPWLDEGVGIK